MRNIFLSLFLSMAVAKDAYQLSLISPQNAKYPLGQAIPITLEISEISDVAAVGFSATYSISFNGNIVASSSTSFQSSSTAGVAQPYSWVDSFTPGSTGSYNFRMEFQTRCTSTKQTLTASFTVAQSVPFPSTNTPSMQISVPSDSNWESCLKNAGKGSASMQVSSSVSSSSSSAGASKQQSSSEFRAFSSSSFSMVSSAFVVGAGLMGL